MANNVITKDIGNLRGISTDSIYQRPVNVAEIATNVMRTPTNDISPRRGYQAKAAARGGLGTETFDDPTTFGIKAFTADIQGYGYELLQRQVCMTYYDDISGAITSITAANPPLVTTTAAHGLSTGDLVRIESVQDMYQVNGFVFSINVTGANTFELDGIDASTYLAGTGGAFYSASGLGRYLTLEVYTDNAVYEPTTSGAITGATQANPCEITAVAHGLLTGDRIRIEDVSGMTELNDTFYTIIVTGNDTFTIGVDSTAYTPYTAGGTWTTAPQESISFEAIEYRAAQVDGDQAATNTVTVDSGHTVVAGDIVILTDSTGVEYRRVVDTVGATSITFFGDAIAFSDDAYIQRVLTINFLKGIDENSPYLISSWISALQTFLPSLRIDANGLTDSPAAFLPLLETKIVPAGHEICIDYCYWELTNSPISLPFQAEIDPDYLNSPQFENISMVTFDDVLYMASGRSFPKKFDGVNLYRVGMPRGARPTSVEVDQVGTLGTLTANTDYEYFITYEFVDAVGHILEGAPSLVRDYTPGADMSALINVDPIASDSGFNTNVAIVNGSGSDFTTTPYGADLNDFYYHLVDVDPAFTLVKGDTAFFLDNQLAQSDGTALFGDITSTSNTTPVTVTTTAPHGLATGDLVSLADITTATDLNNQVFRVTVTGASTFTLDGSVGTAVGAGGMFQVVSNTITVDAGHGVAVGDDVYFTDYLGRDQFRLVTAITDTSITVFGEPTALADNTYIEGYLTGKVYGSVAITDAFQGLNNTFNVITGHTLVANDFITFLDDDNQMQRREVTAVTATTVTISGSPVTLRDGTLLEKESLEIDSITIQLLKADPVVLSDNDPISANLRIRLYRRQVNDATSYLVGILPNNSLATAQQFRDNYGVEANLGSVYDDPGVSYDPPPISKYLTVFSSQLVYAGGEVGNPEDSDKVFFSEPPNPFTGQGNPEAVPLATNFLVVPNDDADVTGVGVSGSSLAIFKRQSAFAVSGDLITGQYQLSPIAPGSNIGCVAHATIKSVGNLTYFLSEAGVYALTETQIYPTDSFGNPVAISKPIAEYFRSSPFLPEQKFQFKRALAFNYDKDLQYLLYLPCQDPNAENNTANENSVLLCFDYEEKNWFPWKNINAASGIFTIGDDLYFHSRERSGVVGNTANLYKQHRYYRLIDYADHTEQLESEYRTSWEDNANPTVRKKYVRAMLLMDRFTELYQNNVPSIQFRTYLDRIPGVVSTDAEVTMVDNTAVTAWNSSPWGFGVWGGYKDSFIRISMRNGTVAKSIQMGIRLKAINSSYLLSGFQLEVAPDFRRTIVR